MQTSTLINLPAGEAHIWLASLKWTDPTLEQARTVLSAMENARADRFHQDLHRNRYLICHLKVRQILGQYLGQSPESLQFEENRFGKPTLSHETNPTGIDFNLSHSADRMMLGIVRNARIGVDIEEVRPESAQLEVAARFFTEWENQELRKLSGPAQIEAFFNCWTRKEAYLKAIGFGLSKDPRECEVSLLPTDDALLRKAIPDIDDSAEWHLFHLKREGHICAVAVDRPVHFKEKSG